MDNSSSKRHTNDSVAKIFGVPRLVVAAWCKNSLKIMSKDISSPRIANTVRMRKGKFPTLENELVKHLHECARYMDNNALFGADIIV